MCLLQHRKFINKSQGTCANPRQLIEDLVILPVGVWSPVGDKWQGGITASSRLQLYAGIRESPSMLFCKDWFSAELLIPGPLSYIMHFIFVREDSLE